MTEKKSNLERVVTNVVNIQQTIFLQFEQLTKSMETLRLDNAKAISELREDIRRTEDRTQSQFNKETERLHSIINILLAKDSGVAQQPMANPPNPNVAMMVQHQQALMFQQHQQQLAQQQAIQQAELQRALVNASMQSALANATSKPAPPPVAQKTPATPAAPVPAQVPAAVPAIGASTPVKAPVAVEKPKPVEVKAPEVKTSIFGTPTSTSTSSPAPFTFGSNIFGTKSTTTPTINQSPQVKTEHHDDDDAVEEYEPQTEFKPVVPLPDLVEVKTGEEQEECLFANRSKLYIYSNETKEWKERGTGDLKVLHNKESDKYRVVMRRDQVLKVCANFPIIGSMSIQKMATNDKAYTWFCEDFSEETPEMVKLSARFATVEIAQQFKELFEKGIAHHKSTGSTPGKKTERTIDSEIKPAVAVKKEEPVNDENEVKIPSKSETVGFGDKFKLAAGAWECSGCCLQNKPDVDVCPCCSTGRDGKPADKSASIFNKPLNIPTPANGTPKISFGFSAAAAAKDTPKTTSFGGAVNGASPSIFGGGTPKTSIFGGSSPAAGGASFSFGGGAASKPAGTPLFNFNKTAEPATTPSAPAPTTKNPPLFGSSGKTDGTPSFSFGAKPSEVVKTPADSTQKTESKFETPKSIFGSVAGANSSFASFAANSTGKSIFDTSNAKKAQEELASQKKSTVFGSSDTPNKEDDENEDTEEYEPQVDFAPVVPLPDLVDVKTGEEDEEIVFKARCKLFRYIQATQENKERGVGDIKILSKDGKYRVVMRRDQVHKICANFRVDKSIKLTPKVGYTNVFTFMCQDFSDSEESSECHVFTIKFKDEKIADEFKEKFTECQAKLP